MVRAFGSHPRGHGFEPPRLHKKKRTAKQSFSFFNEINPLRGFVKYAPRVKYAFGV